MIGFAPPPAPHWHLRRWLRLVSPSLGGVTRCKLCGTFGRGYASGQNAQPSALCAVTVQNCLDGLRVTKGPAWAMEAMQPGSDGGLGTVVACSRATAKVEWDSAPGVHAGPYHITDGRPDLQVALNRSGCAASSGGGGSASGMPAPRAQAAACAGTGAAPQPLRPETSDAARRVGERVTEDLALPGLRVQRGPDWEGGDDDGSGLPGDVVPRGTILPAEHMGHEARSGSCFVLWDPVFTSLGRGRGRSGGRSTGLYRCGRAGRYELQVSRSRLVRLARGRMFCYNEWTLNPLCSVQLIMQKVPKAGRSPRQQSGVLSFGRAYRSRSVASARQRQGMS